MRLFLNIFNIFNNKAHANSPILLSVTSALIDHMSYRKRLKSATGLLEALSERRDSILLIQAQPLIMHEAGDYAEVCAGRDKRISNHLQFAINL